MRKRWLTFLLTVCVFLLGVIGLTACGDSSTSSSSQPTKLSTPVVTLTDNVASWSADTNADKFEISLDGNLSYVENTITSKPLTDGQTFKVRAVGDGIAYTNSDWSTPVTYTAGAPTPQPTKLSTPMVTISGTGFASWDTVANANGYAYKINNGIEMPTTAMGVQLVDGQSIAVKAVGDGTNYTDSDYSASKTYTANTPTPPPTSTEAPTYLGILASAQEPARTDVPTEFTRTGFAGTYSTRVSLEQALRTYLNNADNALGETAPAQSEYTLYSAIGNTVYIQIWLNNPDQNTILSLKLNGTKYQTGGALQSFFIEDGNSYLNCVYVAVSIPANSYEEIAYEVTEIEYVEGTNISQDGKAVLIDENNDTVVIGLPYEESLPTVTLSNVTQTSSTISFTASVTDVDRFVAQVGGWLRVIIYDDSNTILGQYKLVNGNNTVSFENLSADTYYSVMAFVLGDTHDGNGVYVHTVESARYKTENIITATITSAVLQNEQTDKYYPQISVEATLSDASFSFTRVEVSDWYGTVYYTGDFDGSAKITDGILNGQSYIVKIYYENASGMEQCYQNYDSVYVEYLDYPWVLEPCLKYGLLKDGILGFDFGDNKSNFENLTIKIVDEYSKQYLAEDALYLLANQNVLDELYEVWNAYGDGWRDVYEKWDKLSTAQEKIDKYYPDVQQAEWEAELTKGIYTYVYVYGQDDNFFKGANNKYYILLEDYQSKRVNDASWRYYLTADFDLNNGEGIEEGREIVKGYFEIDPAFAEGDFLFVDNDEHYQPLFTIDENNEVYLKLKSRTAGGYESYRGLGYVTQIVLAKDDEVVKVLWLQEDPDFNVNEADWIANIRQALIAGEDIDSVFPTGELQPITFDLDDVDMSSVEIGKYVMKVAYKMYGKTYTNEKPCDWEYGIDYIVAGALPNATIVWNTNEFGRYDIVYPESIGRWYYYELEVKDENGEFVGTYNQDDSWKVETLSANWSIRVRLTTYTDHEYYTENGAWSDWTVCLPIALNSPTNFTTRYNESGVTVSWEYVNRAEKYVYKVNGGAEQETYDTEVSGLKDGDKLVVKAIPSTENTGYVVSEYSAEYTVEDNRIALEKPVVTFDSYYQRLEWTPVENAVEYVLYNVIRGEEQTRVGADTTSCSVQLGMEYAVKAIPADYETYVGSQSEIVNTTVKLAPPEITIKNGVVSFGQYKEVNGKITYTYVINGGEEQSTREYSEVVTLNDGDTIKVKATCSRTGYEESEWAEATYQA